MPTKTSAFISLTTYHNYVSYWVEAINREYGYAESVHHNIRREQENLGTFNKLKGGSNLSDGLISEFLKAKLIVMSMEKLPIDHFPHIAITENLWMPVKAYYAINAMGRAFLFTTRNNVPTDHKAFLSQFSNSIVRYLPFPFNSLCLGGPEHFQFPSLSISAEDVTRFNQLRSPHNASSQESLGKTLITTRRRGLTKLYNDARKQNIDKERGRTRRNILRPEKEKIAARLHGTSIADLIYRMRIRANYHDSEMYLAAFDSTEDAVASYESLTFLTKTLVISLSTILSRKIGKQAMEFLDNRFSQVSS